MGIFDKAKDMAGDADLGGMADKAKDALEEHGDKIPGGLGDKAKDMLDEHGDKIDGLTDKLPGGE